jgi:hypothetical protein
VRIEQVSWSEGAGWAPHPPGNGAPRLSPPIVFVFGSRAVLSREGALDEVIRAFPAAYIAGCSTAGEICREHVFDDTLVVTALELERSRVECVSIDLPDAEGSTAAGRTLALRLAQLSRNNDLRHIIVLSEGLHVNGSDLVRAFRDHLPQNVAVTGGLSGDGARFEQTLVVAGGVAKTGMVVAIGFYGSSFSVGYGSVGGWDPFGPDRLVTRSAGNVLYELDGQSALALYKKYLGDQARDLPASGLLFPLAIRTEEYDQGLVRTVLAVDDEADSMTFAGDIPEGCNARLMKANFDRLIDGAVGAAKISHETLHCHPEFALLISCVGRKMVLQQRIEEEVEGVREIVGPETVLAGFYSYGEIGPFSTNARCELHNETMTVTTFSER